MWLLPKELKAPDLEKGQLHFRSQLHNIVVQTFPHFLRGRSGISRLGIDNKYITYLISYQTEVDCIVLLAKSSFLKPVRPGWVLRPCYDSPKFFLYQACRSEFLLYQLFVSSANSITKVSEVVRLVASAR